MGYEDLWNNFKKASIWVIGVPGKQTLEEKENIRRDNFPNQIKDKRIDLRSSRIPKKEKSRKPRQLMVKMMKTKGKKKILKATRQKWHIYREQ